MEVFADKPSAKSAMEPPWLAALRCATAKSAIEPPWLAALRCDAAGDICTAPIAAPMAEAVRAEPELGLRAEVAASRFSTAALEPEVSTLLRLRADRLCGVPG